MIHTIIVPGVGGSDYDHWQSKLQRELMSCSRVQQQDWNLPILKDWIAQFVATVVNATQPVQIVAHSFGCLTTVAALAHQRANTRDPVDVLFQRLCNLVLDHFGICTGIPHGYRNDGIIHVGILAYGQAGISDHPENDDDQHQHRG